jgi:hypothetical protein
LSQLATVLLRTLVVFDKSTQIVIVEDKIFVFLGLARKLIQQPSKWPTYDCGKEHASPDEWPAIVAPRDSLSRNEVLRKDFGEDGEQACRDKDRNPDLRSMVESRYNEWKGFAT